MGVRIDEPGQHRRPREVNDPRAVGNLQSARVAHALHAASTDHDNLVRLRGRGHAVDQTPARMTVIGAAAGSAGAAARQTTTLPGARMSWTLPPPAHQSMSKPIPARPDSRSPLLQPPLARCLSRNSLEDLSISALQRADRLVAGTRRDGHLGKGGILPARRGPAGSVGNEEVLHLPASAEAVQH
jgi:hypothetical protein